MKYKYQYGTGIKTGYTSKAGSTFVGSATKDGVDLISVVLLSTTDGKWIDSIRLMNYGFATYERYDPVELYRARPLTVNVDGADPSDANGGVLTLDITAPENADPVCAKKSEISQITSDFSAMLSVSYSRDIKAPINAGDEIGTLTYNAPSGDNNNGMHQHRPHRARRTAATCTANTAMAAMTSAARNTPASAALQRTHPQRRAFRLRRTRPVQPAPHAVPRAPAAL